MTLTILSLSEPAGRIVRRCAAIASVAVVSGCSAPMATAVINDPYEVENRQMHAFNVAADRNVLKPAATAISGDGNGPVQRGVNNFAGNLDVPGDVVNNILQFRLGKAAANTARFVVNTTVGVGGIFDPATAIGLNGKKTDFGETMYVWGVDEGHYLVLPLLGPSTARDALGKVVDYAINPVGMLIKAPESYVVTGAKVIETLGDRAQHSETVDSILYDSADSYAQTRLLYLENRRYDLGQTPADTTFEDPYAQ